MMRRREQVIKLRIMYTFERKEFVSGEEGLFKFIGMGWDGLESNGSFGLTLLDSLHMKSNSIIFHGTESNPI